MTNTDRSTARVLGLILVVGSSLPAACGSDSAPQAGGTGSGQSSSGTRAGSDAMAASGSGSGSGGGSGSASGGGSGTASAGAGSGGTGASGSSGVASAGSSGAVASGASSGAPSVDAGDGPDATIDGGSSGSGGSDGGPVDTSKKITVWLAGDSTMQPCSQNICGGVRPLCGWGSQFQPYFNSNATVVDNAAGGRSIQTWLYEPNVSLTPGPNGECPVSPKTYSARWQAMLDPTNGMKPGDYLFVEFGINDGIGTCDRHVGTALFQSYLGVMAQAAQSRGAHPVFLTSTSAIQCTGTMATPNRGFGPETKAAGAANNVPVIDLTQLTAAFYTSSGFCPNDANYLSTTTPVGLFFCDDHTHFEMAGASKMAGVVAKALRDQNIALAAYLK